MLKLGNTHIDVGAGALPNTIQESLVMRFAILRGLVSVTIEGSKLPWVERKLRKVRKIHGVTTAEHLE